MSDLCIKVEQHNQSQEYIEAQRLTKQAVALCKETGERSGIYFIALRLLNEGLTTIY